MISIKHSCANIYKRPRVSYKLLELVTQYYNKAVFESNELVKKDWKVFVCLMLDDVDLLYTAGKEFLVLPPTIFKREKIRSHEVMLPYNKIIEAEDVMSIYRSTINAVLRDLIQQFYGKSISVNLLEDVFNKVEQLNVEMFAYPALFDEQFYEEDSDPMTKAIYISKFGG